jgi:hypothetical protein
VTPLFSKLNLKGQTTIHVIGAPPSFDGELQQLSGVDVKRTITAKTRTSFAMAFAVTQAELDLRSTALARAADGDAVIWIAYPKGTSKRYRCEFNRDTGWTVLAAAGFEPVRMVAIDEDWSALRFRRVEFVKSLTRDASRTLTAEGKTRARKA